LQTVDREVRLLVDRKLLGVDEAALGATALELVPGGRQMPSGQLLGDADVVQANQTGFGNRIPDLIVFLDQQLPGVVQLAVADGDLLADDTRQLIVADPGALLMLGEVGNDSLGQLRTGKPFCHFVFSHLTSPGLRNVAWR